MTADHESSNASLAGPPPLVFQNVSVLLRPKLWSAWLAKHPDHADVLANGHGYLVVLTTHTQWDPERVLDRLGCDTDSEDRFLDLSEDQMKLCGEYFQWVAVLLSNLDLPSDKRLAVSGAARFFAAAEKNLDACKTIMRSGPFPPIEYLKLGEIAQSWQCAIRGLDSPRGQRARATEQRNPFVDAKTPHLSPKRLDMLALQDSQHLLGANVEERILEHLDNCAICANAQERCTKASARRSVGLLTTTV
jgi:hypothetical protein